ncbi:MAG: tripartite tricarboxylate transporter substrate binding protein [Rhodospirillaceae bacterium]
MKRTRLVLLTGAISALLAFDAAAQTYPSRPVRLVVPQSAGGSTDLVARPLAQKLTEALGQQVVVDNRPGAGSTIGTELVAKAAPDGHTLLAVAASFTMSPALYKNLPFDPVRDFSAISELSALPNILVVHPSLPVTNLKELIALVKTKPGEINHGSSGVATGTHMSMELLKHLTGMRMVHVPYKGGAPSVTALLANEVQVTFATISTALPHVKTGRLRALAVSTAKRSAAAPDVPTIDEAGVPGYDYSSWIGLLAPARTPPAIVTTLHRETARIVQMPEIRKVLALEGSDPIGSTPAQFSALIRTEVARWKQVAQSAGIKGD